MVHMDLFQIVQWLELSSLTGQQRHFLTLTHHITLKLPSGTTYTVGDIIVGRSQTLVIPKTDLTEVELTYDNGMTDTITVNNSDGIMTDAIYLENLRIEMEDIKKVKHFGSVVSRHLVQLKELIDSKADSTEFMKDISRDIQSDDDGEGQIMKACSCAKWWDTWGRNHWSSILSCAKTSTVCKFQG